MSTNTQSIHGMTVNERLVHLGLMTAFEEAMRTRKLESVVAVLRQAQFSQSQAEQTATSLLANPGRYGY